MSTRRLAAGSFANLLIPLSGLLVSPFLSRELGPEQRGLYAALTLPIVVCGWIGTGGLQDSLSFHLRNGTLSKRSAAKLGLIAAVPLGLLGVAVLGFAGRFIFSGDQEQYHQFLVLAALAPLHILVNLLIGGLTGGSDLRGVNLVKVVPAFARTGLVVFACLAFDLNAFWAALLFVASVVPGLFIGLRRLRRTGPGVSTEEPPAGSALPIGSLLRYSLACLPGSLAAVSSARLDQVVGLPLIGPAQLGYYAVAVSVAEIPMVIATAGRTLLLGRPTSDQPRQSTRVARLAVTASVLACGLLVAFAGVAVPWFFGRSFAPAVAPTVILCAATTIYACMTLFTAVLLADGRAAWSSAALVIGAAVGLALLVVLAPFGAVGAAVASVGGYGVATAMAALALRRGVYSVRMLTVPYREDLGYLIRESLRSLAKLFRSRRAGQDVERVPTP